MTWRTYKEFGPIDQHVVSNRMTARQDYDFWPAAVRTPVWIQRC